MTGLESYASCRRCAAPQPEHDRTDYGDGRALVSAAAILLREAGADDAHVAAVCDALERAA